jgi:hypothetical protein
LTVLQQKWITKKLVVGRVNGTFGPKNKQKIGNNIMIKIPSLLSFCKDKISKKCNVRRAQMAAVAFTNRGHIIASSVNVGFRGSMTDNKDKYSMHAEEAVIKKLLKLKAKERFDTINLLVIRHSKKKGITCSKPCKNCSKQINKYGFNEVFYTDWDGVLTSFIKGLVEGREI